MEKHTSLKIAVNHPAFAGHFPSSPIVPGVLLLDKVMQAIAIDTGLTEIAWQINSVKFLSPLKPNEAVIIKHEQLANGSVKFEVVEGVRQIVIGNLIVRQIAQNA